jgi:hypothetical protein
MTLEQWTRLVGATVRDVTEEQAASIAQRAMDAAESGAPIGVWHSASIEFGTLDKCQCWPCVQVRKVRS